MRLPLCYPIESRDGTLNADSKLKNMVVENVEGEQVAVKRPGVTKQTELPPGIAQGLFSLNGIVYQFVDDKVFKFDTNGIFLGGFNLVTGQGLAIYNSLSTYSYDDEVYAQDEEHGALIRYYAHSPDANKQRPGQAGWRGMMWGTDPGGSVARYVATGRGINLSGTTPPLITAYGSTMAAAFSACCAGMRLTDSNGTFSQSMNDPFSLPNQLTAYVTNISNGITVNSGLQVILTMNPV